MRHDWRIAFFLLSCCAADSVIAQTPASVGAHVAILQIDHRIDIGATSFAQILEDPSGKLDLQSVREVSDGWRNGASDALAFGFSKSVWWVRLRIENTANRSVDAVLDLGNPRQDFVHWFLLRSDGRFLEEASSGDRLPQSHRPLPTRNFALPIPLSAHERVEVIMRLQSYDGLFESMPLRLSSRVAFFESAANEGHLLALYHGGLLALALYNLLLFVATRERAFGWYVLYLSFFSIWSFTFRGFAFQYLWPNSPAFNNDILTVSTAWTFASIGCFTLSYLRLRELAPRWLFNVVLMLVAINALLAIPAFMGYYAIGRGIELVAGTALVVTTASTSIWLLFKGSRQARFYVIAFAVVSVGALSYVLQVVTLVPTNWFTTWGIQIGSAIEVLLLALGLADSMNTLRAQKIAAERQAREAQEALNTQLAQQVNERTEALELANRRLHELAITDELTGAFNRRHFSAFCGAALTHRDRNEALAFCIFDIDFFKAFNERYGHDAGNGALRAIANAVRDKLRRSADVLFRLGGEEFGILFTASTPDSARQFVEGLRLSIRALQIPHETVHGGVVTASFGVGWWGVEATDVLTPNQMYAVADNMIYESKNSGRDRVSVEVHSAAEPEASVQNLGT